MDHVDAMLQRDSYNIILSEVGPDRRQSLSDLVRLIGLDMRG